MYASHQEYCRIPSFTVMFSSSFSSLWRKWKCSLLLKFVGKYGKLVLDLQVLDRQVFIRILEALVPEIICLFNGRLMNTDSISTGVSGQLRCFNSSWFSLNRLHLEINSFFWFTQLLVIDLFRTVPYGLWFSTVIVVAPSFLILLAPFFPHS